LFESSPEKLGRDVMAACDALRAVSQGTPTSASLTPLMLRRVANVLRSARSMPLKVEGCPRGQALAEEARGTGRTQTDQAKLIELTKSEQVAKVIDLQARRPR